MSWTDRVVEYPNRVTLTAVSGQDNTFNMEPAEGTVYVEGTLLNADNLNNETMNLIGGVVADDWSSSRSYAIGDSCIYNNMLWNCLVANTNTEPTEGTYWTRMKLAKDYIVDEGTSGIWTYRKWASGIAECWGRQTFTGAANVTWGSLYITPTMTAQSYPFSFVEAPEINYNVDSSTSLIPIPNGNVGTKAKPPNLQFARGNSSSTATAITVHWSAKGRWK